MSTLIDLQQVTKSYHLGDNDLPVLKKVDLTIQQGELLSIMGASGSGKSTLMNIIGLLDRHDDGQFLLQDKQVSQYSDDELAAIRNKTIGFVFQQFFLLPRLTAIQNVCLPLLYRGIKAKQRKLRAMEELEKVGMANYANHRPSELSGGQQQRVAIARALVGDPSVLLADEPTGALDSKIGQEVMDLFVSLNRDYNRTIIIITHDPNIAAQCNRTVHIQDGLIVSEL